MAGQFHFDPATYLAMVRAEVPAYDEMQDAVAASTGESVTAVLDLGTGTGETLRRVAARHRGARLVGVDESESMLSHARGVVPNAELEVARLEDALPPGPFDVVVAALAVHHLDGTGKADLFRRIAAVLVPAGRFVMGDVVVPDDPADVVTPIDGTYDTPSRVDEQLEWLAAAGFDARVPWQRQDLVVIVATKRRPARSRGRQASRRVRDCREFG